MYGGPAQLKYKKRVTARLIVASRLSGKPIDGNAPANSIFAKEMLDSETFHNIKLGRDGWNRARLALTEFNAELKLAFLKNPFSVALDDVAAYVLQAKSLIYTAFIDDPQHAAIAKRVKIDVHSFENEHVIGNEDEIIYKYKDKCKVKEALRKKRIDEKIAVEIVRDPKNLKKYVDMCTGYEKVAAFLSKKYVKKTYKPRKPQIAGVERTGRAVVTRRLGPRPPPGVAEFIAARKNADGRSSGSSSSSSSAGSSSSSSSRPQAATTTTRASRSRNQTALPPPAPKPLLSTAEILSTKQHLWGDRSRREQPKSIYRSLGRGGGAVLVQAPTIQPTYLERETWSRDETRTLLMGVSCGKNFVEIASRLPLRDNQDCSYKMTNLKRKYKNDRKAIIRAFLTKAEIASAKQFKKSGSSVAPVEAALPRSARKRTQRVQLNYKEASSGDEDDSVSESDSDFEGGDESDESDESFDSADDGVVNLSSDDSDSDDELDDEDQQQSGTDEDGDDVSFVEVVQPKKKITAAAFKPVRGRVSKNGNYNKDPVSEEEEYDARDASKAEVVQSKKKIATTAFRPVKGRASLSGNYDSDLESEEEDYDVSDASGVEVIQPKKQLKKLPSKPVKKRASKSGNYDSDLESDEEEYDASDVEVVQQRKQIKKSQVKSVRGKAGKRSNYDRDSESDDGNYEEDDESDIEVQQQQRQVKRQPPKAAKGKASKHSDYSMDTDSDDNDEDLSDVEVLLRQNQIMKAPLKSAKRKASSRRRYNDEDSASDEEPRYSESSDVEGDESGNYCNPNDFADDDLDNSDNPVSDEEQPSRQKPYRLKKKARVVRPPRKSTRDNWSKRDSESVIRGKRDGLSMDEIVQSLQDSVRTAVQCNDHWKTKWKQAKGKTNEEKQRNCKKSLKEN
jgi:hypothetical protein